jgi:hypothetical protein
MAHLAGAAYFIFSKASRMAFGLTHSLFCGHWDSSPPPDGDGDKAKHTCQCSAIFRMGGAIPPLPLYALLVCIGMKVYIYHPCFSVSGLINLGHCACYRIYTSKDDFVMLHTRET